VLLILGPFVLEIMPLFVLGKAAGGRAPQAKTAVAGDNTLNDWSDASFVAYQPLNPTEV
jgi:hypothetical protein